MVRVLLTRAADDAARTREALERLGHEVVVSPVISIEPTGAPWPRGAVDALLATSARAFLSTIAEWGPPLHVRRVLPLGLVGRRAEEAARSRGFLGPVTVAATSSALVQALAEGPPRRRVVYAAGRDRKPTAEAHLAVGGVDIEILETYVAAPADRLDPEAARELASGGIRAVLHFSRRSAYLFLSLVEREGLSCDALNLCLSDDVAEPLRAAGRVVRVATEPSETSLLALLEKRPTAP